MSKLTFFLLITFATLLEATITSIPLVSLVLLVFYILKRSSQMFFPAFVSGIVLDIFSVRTLGLSSIFFIAFIFIILQYARKFEISTYPFVFFSSFLEGLFYLWVFGYDNVFGQALVSALVAILLFGIIIDLNKMSNLTQRVILKEQSD